MALIESDNGVRELLQRVKRVAVLGIKTEEQAEQAAFYVPKYLVKVGLQVVPVPVYFPDVKEILGLPVYRKLTDIPGPVDMVNVFRHPHDIDAHVADLVAMKPRSVWFQLGIRNDAAAAKLSAAGIDVVQNRCLMVDHRHYVQR